MHYRLTAKLDRLDEEQCSLVIEEMENAFKRAGVRGTIFISTGADPVGLEKAPGALNVMKYASVPEEG